MEMGKWLLYLMFQSQVAVLDKQALYMHSPSFNNLDVHYDAVIDMTPEDIIQQYEDEAQAVMYHLNQKCAEMMMVPRYKSISRTKVQDRWVLHNRNNVVVMKVRILIILMMPKRKKQNVTQMNIWDVPLFPPRSRRRT